MLIFAVSLFNGLDKFLDSAEETTGSNRHIGFCEGDETVSGTDGAGREIIG